MSGPTQPIVEASLWSADLGALARDVERMSRIADSFHIDVADAHFIPALLFFPELLAAIRAYSSAPFHVHLMTADPVQVVEAFCKAGADAITVHAETGDKAAQAIEAIRKLGKSAGVALRADTEPRAAIDFLPEVDRIVMIGTPMGTRGSELVPDASTRLRELRSLLGARPAAAAVTVLADGGIRDHTVPQLLAAGADGVVAGSLLFGSVEPAATAAWIRSLPIGRAVAT
jgi:ribulose-phosphate 3-epimerase